MLTLEVAPEHSLGCEQWEFVIGMHFSQAVAIIQSQVGLIKKVNVLYSDVNPLEADLIINLTNDGVKLYFDPITQRLKIIEIYNMKNVKLKYCGNAFNSSEVMPTIDIIEHIFGATHPAVFDRDRKEFILHFRGLSFYFPFDPRLHTFNQGNIQFRRGCSPLVSKLTIYCGANEEQACSPELPLSCFQGQLYCKKAEILRGDSYTKGLKLILSAGTNSRMIDLKCIEFERELLLGSSVQDVASAIGAPSKVFYRSEDKMKIHSPNPHRRITSSRSDYFFNYFTLGLDVLFDGRSHQCKKVILHTNYPGHYNFNMYMRCEFNLWVGSDEPITAYSLWKDVCKKLTPSEEPVVLNRTSSTNSVNPFGSTLCYGYQDVIFELLPNGYIASLTVYGDGTKPYHSDKVASA